MEEMAEAPDGGAAKASSAAAPSPPAEKKVPKEELPVLRLDPRETPVHGLGSEKFSIEIHHGGFFLGSGLNVQYLDEKVAWFDNLDRRTFCNGIIDYMISQGPSRRVQIVDPVPEESAFVAEHRATIPAARGPQVNTSGRALGTATRARGRGSRGGGSARSSGRGRVAHQAPAHQAADAEASGSTRPKTGRLKWLMFGPAKKSKQVPEAAPADVG